MAILHRRQPDLPRCIRPCQQESLWRMGEPNWPGQPGQSAMGGLCPDGAPRARKKLDRHRNEPNPPRPSLPAKDRQVSSGSRDGRILHTDSCRWLTGGAASVSEHNPAERHVGSDPESPPSSGMEETKDCERSISGQQGETGREEARLTSSSLPRSQRGRPHAGCNPTRCRTRRSP